jgi:hypothetical protein
LSITMPGSASINTATWNPTMVVLFPVTGIPGAYTGTVTHSVT